MRTFLELTVGQNPDGTMVAYGGEDFETGISSGNMDPAACQAFVMNLVSKAFARLAPTKDTTSEEVVPKMFRLRVNTDPKDNMARINQIKALREVTGMMLSEARDQVEACHIQDYFRPGLTEDVVLVLRNAGFIVEEVP
jgi:ribosomal protein L7/L12